MLSQLCLNCVICLCCKVFCLGFTVSLDDQKYSCYYDDLGRLRTDTGFPKIDRAQMKEN